MTDPAAVRTADARATDAVTPDEADFRPLSLPRIAARLDRKSTRLNSSHVD